MNEIPMLDLFSGIGGFALAGEIANAMADAECRAQQKQGHKAGPKLLGGGARMESCGYRFHSIAHSELEPFACAVYHSRFPDSACLGAVENVTRDAVLERCGVLPVVVCGGFPCQPHSCAGKRLASADDRDLWGECARILGDIRPRFALFENVGGLLTSESGLFFNRVLSDLAQMRFACQWQVVPASAVGAPHRRDRVWMLCWDEVADTERERRCGGNGKRKNADHAQSPGTGTLLYPALAGHWPSRPGEPQGGWEPPRVVGQSAKPGLSHKRGEREPMGEPGAQPEPERPDEARPGQRQIESALGNDVDGLPATVGGTWPEVHNRVAQLKAAGNAIVPQCAAIFLDAIRRMIESDTSR